MGKGEKMKGEKMKGEKMKGEKMRTKITITWQLDDIILRGSDHHGIMITKNQASEILDKLATSHDCEIGISWPVIDVAIQEYFKK